MKGQKYVALLKGKLELHIAVYKCKTFMQGGVHHSKSSYHFLEVKEYQSPSTCKEK